mgnify:CR=1 FL=1
MLLRGAGGGVQGGVGDEGADVVGLLLRSVGQRPFHAVRPISGAGFEGQPTEEGQASAKESIGEAGGDLDKAAQRVAFGGFYQAGQSCISVQRVYVQRSAYDELLGMARKGRARTPCGTSACSATEAALPQASVRDCPASTPAASASRNARAAPEKRS